MWDFTYEMIHRETGFKLGAGKVIAWDGVRAAPGIARQIRKRLRQLRDKPKKSNADPAAHRHAPPPPTRPHPQHDRQGAGGD